MSIKKRPLSGKSSSLSLVLPLDLTDQLVARIMALRGSVKTDYLKESLLSKFVSSETDPPSTRRNRAICKWLAAERDNEATNERLILTPGDFNILPRVTFESFIDRCRGIIAGIIGDTPTVDSLVGSFSGGASTSRCRTESHPAFKYLGKAHVTQRCLDIFIDTVVDEVPGWLNAQNPLLIEVVPGNVLFTVPKKTDIDRVACKEPDLNMFIQKGIGSSFRTALMRIGINLNDQSINRSLAHRGSVTNELATLDLSSASDSVTEGLTALLLPETWYTLLDAVRCHVTVIDGEEHSNQMFSSMGNGFTFELESLLFYSIARTVAYFRGTPGVVSVYGDDIICPAGMSHELTFVLNYLGFQVNMDKSFYEGPFRESCGGHYWNGLDITPFYIRAPICDLASLIDVTNKLRQWAILGTPAGPFSTVLDPEVEDIWKWLKGFIPDCLWGGGDTSFKYQLVSEDTPKMRIQEETRRRGTGEGGYYHWLNATWGRTGNTDGVSTSRRLVNLSKYRLKPVLQTAVPRLPALFLHEIGLASETKAP